MASNLPLHKHMVAVLHRRVGNLTVTLIVFFGPGRRAVQRVTQCYVERNLAINGGIVSDVIWEAHASLVAADLALIQARMPSMRSAEIACRGRTTRTDRFGPRAWRKVLIQPAKGSSIGADI